MSRLCCLAGIDPTMVPKLGAVLAAAGEADPPRLAKLDVRELGALRPDLIIGDLDHLEVDPLELLRQIRFVLPASLIAVYSDDSRQSWGRECHMAGANCMLSKASTEPELAAGVQDAIDSGCFTDPHFRT